MSVLESILCISHNSENLHCGLSAKQEERSSKLEILSALEAKLAEQQKELSQYADSDPKRYKEISETPGLCSFSRWS